jgi:hypothetical protein
MWTSDVDSLSRLSAPSSRAGRVSRRTQRRLVASLRRLARLESPRGGIRRRFEVILYDRIALVRTDLLEIAELLEQAPDPDSRCMTELQRLLTDGCESALFNPDVHPSELRASLYYVHSRLTNPRAILT